MYSYLLFLGVFLRMQQFTSHWQRWRRWAMDHAHVAHETIIEDLLVGGRTLGTIACWGCQRRRTHGEEWGFTLIVSIIGHTMASGWVKAPTCTISSFFSWHWKWTWWRFSLTTPFGCGCSGWWWFWNLQKRHQRSQMAVALLVMCQQRCHANCCLLALVGKIELVLYGFGWSASSNFGCGWSEPLAFWGICDSVDNLRLLQWLFVASFEALLFVASSFEPPGHAAHILESIRSGNQGVGRVMHTLDRCPWSRLFLTTNRTVAHHTEHVCDMSWAGRLFIQTFRWISYFTYEPTLALSPTCQNLFVHKMACTMASGVPPPTIPFAAFIMAGKWWFLFYCFDVSHQKVVHLKFRCDVWFLVWHANKKLHFVASHQ